MAGKFTKALKAVKYLKGRNISVSDLAGDVNIKSNCEGDPQEVKQEHQMMEGKRRSGHVLFLSPGHFSVRTFQFHPRFDRIEECLRRKTLLFYQFTDATVFSPLKSQGVDSRSEYIRVKRVASAPLVIAEEYIHTCLPTW